MINQEKRCVRCVMDTSDPFIVFDNKGICNHCKKFDEVTFKEWPLKERGQERLEEIIDKIKKDGEGKEYDCIIGLSGGLDSSYLAVFLKDYNLRALAVHVDAGWNSELSVYNIEQVVKHCGYNLHTHVINWSDMRNLQLAYLESGVCNQDVPQDHIFFSSLYHFATKNKIRYIISGGNISTESISPDSWHHSAMDSINIRSIYKKFGKKKLENYKTISFFQYYIYYPFFCKMKTIRPLDFIDYNRKDALDTLKNKIGYKEYGEKHCESVFTKFFQNYYLPKRFGYDKRKLHFSSMILSGQIDRNEALKQLGETLYDEENLKQDFKYIAQKLKISEEKLKEFIELPPSSYSCYRNWDSLYKIIKKTQFLFSKLLKKNLSNYS